MFNIRGKKCKFWVGGKKVKKIYLGAKKVFSAGNWVTYKVDTNDTRSEEWDEGSSVLTPTTFTPTKSGWTFHGWKETLDAVSNVLTSKIMGDDPITLYGVFKKLITLKVYNNSTTATEKTGYSYYNNANVQNPSFTVSPATKSGWAFLGWTKDTSADGDIAYNSITNTKFSEDTTLYGKYGQNVTLEYNGNGATGGNTPSQTALKMMNTSGDMQSPTFVVANNKFTKYGYDFVNWALNSISGNRYSPNALLNLSTNSIMYAIWEKIINYIYHNGTLAGDVKTSSFTSNGNKLSASASVSDVDEKQTTIASISNIDLTGYSTLDVFIRYETCVFYANASITYGIDKNYNNTLQGTCGADPFYDTRWATTKISLDVSSYTGVHSLDFKLYVSNKSSDYGADCKLEITSVQLHYLEVSEYEQSPDVFVNGVIAENITSHENFALSGSTLLGEVDVDPDESAEKDCVIGGIIMTNYSKMEVDIDYNTSVFFGSASIDYGIDSYTKSLPGTSSTSSTTLTFDISSYTGLHSLKFHVKAKSGSSTYGAGCHVRIKRITLIP